MNRPSFKTGTITEKNGDVADGARACSLACSRLAIVAVMIALRGGHSLIGAESTEDLGSNALLWQWHHRHYLLHRPLHREAGRHEPKFTHQPAAIAERIKDGAEKDAQIEPGAQPLDVVKIVHQLL